VSIPKWDDHALRAFLYYSDQETTFVGKIYQLFKQHNEHRIVYDRIVTLLDYKLFGKLNYVHLMLIGNLSLVGLLAVFVAVLRRAGLTVFHALPVALLLFNLSQWENMFWGMASLQNFSVVLWVVAAFYLLSYTHWWLLAFVAGVLATLTSGNGLMVWPVGFVLLALRLLIYPASRSQSPYRPLVGWLLGAAVVMGLYFTGFQKPGGIAYVRPGIVDLVKGWFAVVGAAAEVLPFGNPLRSSMVSGALLVLAMLALVGWSLLENRFILAQLVRGLVKSRTTSSPFSRAIPPITLFFWGCAGFLLGTAAVVAWARTGFGFDLLITSRYKMYSLMSLVLLYMYGMITIPTQFTRGWLSIAVAGSLAFAVLSYYAFLDEIIWWRHWNTTNQFNSTHTTNSPVTTTDSISQRYNPPIPAFYDKAMSAIYGPAKASTVGVEVVNKADGFSIENTTVEPQGLRDEGTYIVARSAKRTYLFPVWQNQQAITAAQFRTANLFTAGFKADSRQSNALDAGTYQLFVLVVSGKKPAVLHPTNQTIVSTGPSSTEAAKNW
jgi:hypothetical protein